MVVVETGGVRREVVETKAVEDVREVVVVETGTEEGVMLWSWREVVEIPGRTVDLLEAMSTELREKKKS